MNQNTRWADRMLILFFLASLSLPGITTRMHNKIESESRLLRQMQPEQVFLEGFRGVVTAVETFFNDHFGFRNHLVTLHNRILVLYREHSGKNVLIGKNRWLFFASDSLLGDISGQRLFTEEELNRWKRSLTIKKSALADIGVSYIFVVAPNKHAVYPENLPETYRRAAGYTRTGQWLDAMRKDDRLPVVDLHDPLRDASGVFSVYRPTDTHWNDYGASVAADIIFSRLRHIIPDMEEFPFFPDEFDRVTMRGGDLAEMLNLSGYYKETVPKRKNGRLERVIQTGRATNTFFGRSETVWRIPGKTKRLLLVGDSFILGLDRILATGFTETVSVRVHDHHLHHPDFLVHYVHRYRPDVVVEIRAGRLLLDTTPENPNRSNIRNYPVWLQRYVIGTDYLQSSESAPARDSVPGRKPFSPGRRGTERGEILESDVTGPVPMTKQ